MDCWQAFPEDRKVQDVGSRDEAEMVGVHNSTVSCHWH